MRPLQLVPEWWGTVIRPWKSTQNGTQKEKCVPAESPLLLASHKKVRSKKTETSPDTKPIRGMRTAPPTNPFQPGNQQANLTDVHYLFPLCCNRNATSLITNNRGCVIPKRVINVYRNVYRIYFRTRECAFITGLVACCIVPFAAPIYLRLINLPFLLYLIFYIILIQSLQTFRNRRNISPFCCK